MEKGTIPLPKPDLADFGSVVLRVRGRAIGLE
jgi:hypothetical protein